MRQFAVVLALLVAGCGSSSAPPGPVDGNAGMMVSNETVMSDALGGANGNGAAPAQR